MSDKLENLAELYYAKLKTSNNPGVVLAQLYGTLFGIEVTRSEIISCNMLIRTFGKYSVYLSLIDISRKESFPEFPYGLIFKICRDRLEATIQSDITMSSHESLNSLLNSIEKDMTKVKKIDPENVMGLIEED